LRIDPAHRPPGFEQVATYQPTFLYEALWNLALIAVLLWIERHRRLRPGRLFALYVGGYALGRLWVESLRIDHANTILGLRVNIWVSVVTIAAVAAFFAWDRSRARRARPVEVSDPSGGGAPDPPPTAGG
jgi:prolipoprotein diacylglyceryltransferase